MATAQEDEIPEGSTRCRASGIASAFDCMYRWEGDAILKLRKASSPRAMLGTAVHHGTAVYDTATMQGNPISIGDAAEAVVLSLKEENQKGVDWTGSDLRPREVEKIALDVYTRYCQEWSPRFEYAAVEMKVKPMTIDCGGGTSITLTGQLDRTRVYRMKSAGLEILRVGDLKTGSRIVTAAGTIDAKKHRAQVGTYEVLVENTLDKPVDTTSEILGLSTSGNGKIALGEVTGSRQLLLGTPEWPGLLELLADNLRAGRFPPNPSSPLCSKRYCARWDTCPYHE